jgi:GTP-binding protein Era
MAHKAGFVNIIGKPNVGKSTLMNAMVGEKLSVISSKAQTTRHRIKGILSSDDYQVVFSDTPGIIEPHYQLHHSMMNEVQEAILDGDILLYLVEPADKQPDERIVKIDTVSGQRLIIVINKIDSITQPEAQVLIDYWQELFPKALILPVSALYNFNLEKLLANIIENLPEHPAYYEKDELTDRNYRFFVSEIIREKILLLYQKEVPYSVEVVVEQFKEEEKITHISSMIYVARETQKIILIGKGGRAIKQLGTDARKDIEKFLDKKVFLELRVKVDKEWRNSELALKRFGYK